MGSIRLAEKQKRIKSLREFLKEEATVDPIIRTKLEGLLADFQRFLVSIWGVTELSESQLGELSTYERRIETLSEDARMIVNPRAS